MVKNLKKGDEVVTVGGIYGRIMSLDAEKVSLKVSDNVKIDVERSKVVRVVTPKVEEVEAK
ncbi:preprotein translocase subunit YajC [compost metagenome]